MYIGMRDSPCVISCHRARGEWDLDALESIFRRRGPPRLKTCSVYARVVSSILEFIFAHTRELLTDAGVSDYSIFLDEETLTLFASWKLREDNTTADLPNHPIVKKWWAFMADFMDTNPDNSPVCTPLNEVFYMA